MKNKQARLSICMVTSTHLPKVGGTQKQAQQMAKKLNQAGCDCVILTRNHLSIAPFEVIDGVEVYRLPSRGGVVLASLIFVVMAVLWLAKHKDRFQLIHCHQLHSPSTIGLIAKILWGKKVVSRVTRSGRFGELNEIRRLPFASLRLKLLRNLDRIVALNNETVGELLQAGFLPEKIVLIPNGCDAAYEPDFDKTAARRAMGFKGEKIVIYTAGHLDESKGVDTLLKAWDKLIHLTDRARLILLGEGRLFDKLKFDYNRLAASAIDFFGAKSNTGGYMKCADIFVQPSLSEGMSNSLLEAMGLGLAIVATDIGGNRDLIKDNLNGLLVPPGDAHAICAAIMELLTDEGECARMGRNAYLDVKNNYSVDKFINRYLQLYEEILAQ